MYIFNSFLYVGFDCKVSTITINILLPSENPSYFATKTYKVATNYIDMNFLNFKPFIDYLIVLIVELF